MPVGVSKVCEDRGIEISTGRPNGAPNTLVSHGSRHMKFGMPVRVDGLRITEKLPCKYVGRSVRGSFLA